MSGNEQKEIQKIVLNQLASDTRLNNVFKEVKLPKGSFRPDLKEVLCYGKLSVACFEKLSGKLLKRSHENKFS